MRPKNRKRYYRHTDREAYRYAAPFPTKWLRSKIYYLRKRRNESCFDNYQTVRYKHKKKKTKITFKTSPYQASKFLEKQIWYSKQINSCIKELLPAYKVIKAVVKIIKDTKTIIVEVKAIYQNTKHLIDLLKIHPDGKILPTKDEFKDLVEIVKSSNEIINAIKDAFNSIGVVYSFNNK